MLLSKRQCSKNIFGHSQEHDHCFLCKPHNDDKCATFTDQQTQLLSSNPENLILSIAAEFMRIYQPEVFEIPNNVKLLEDLNFDYFLDLAHKNGMSEDNPSTFFIEHMFPDTLEHSLKPECYIDQQASEIIDETQTSE